MADQQVLDDARATADEQVHAAPTDADEQHGVVSDVLVEEVSIDGMCGVY